MIGQPLTVAATLRLFSNQTHDRPLSPNQPGWDRQSSNSRNLRSLDAYCARGSTHTEMLMRHSAGQINLPSRAEAGAAMHLPCDMLLLNITLCDARSLSRLRHKNSGGWLENCRAKWPRNPLDLRQAKRLGNSFAETLTHAHQQPRRNPRHKA